jgi:hypothetical protein
VKKINNILIHNESGMALLMVISSIALLTYLLADFTFETKVNQIKAYNAQDRIQARLTAEAGLHFSLAKLRIYQEARNKMEQNESLKKTIQPSVLDQVLSQPFIYPIPVAEGLSIIQKNAIKDFEEGTAIKGELSVTMSKVNGFLNPNNLRIIPSANGSNDDDDDQRNGSDYDNDQNKKEAKTPLQITEDKILQMLKDVFEQQRETSEFFNLNFSNLDPEILVKELKYYVNNKGAIDDPMFPEIEQKYTEIDLKPKHAPMASIDEFYLLAGWPEYITNLVIDRFTVHEVGYIALNEINENTLKLIFPTITDLQSEEFFKHRDGDQELQEEPKPFKSVEDFKNLVVNTLNIVNSQKFDERQNEFKAANLNFGVAGKLYLVESIGTYNTATVKIQAYVDLPVKPQPPQTDPNAKNNGNKNPNPVNPDEDPEDDADRDTQGEQGTDQTKDKKKVETKTEFMVPRIIEIRVD